MILSFGGKSPRDEGAAFVADNATVQGDVLLKPGTTVWYGAVLRGDSGTLTYPGENTNIQDMPSSTATRAGKCCWAGGAAGRKKQNRINLSNT